MKISSLYAKLMYKYYCMQVRTPAYLSQEECGPGEMQKALEAFIQYLSKQPDDYFRTVNASRQQSIQKCEDKGKYYPDSQSTDIVLPGKKPTPCLTWGSKDIETPYLKWEVEFPQDVITFFKTADPSICAAIISEINSLASGINFELYNKLDCNGIQLFEKKVGNTNILFQLPVQFSPKLSIQSEVHVFSEVIRIWSILHTSDQRKVSIETVMKCLQRGQLAHPYARLLLTEVADHPPMYNKALRYPRFFQYDESSSGDRIVCYPAGSAKNHEFNLIHFYPFDGNFIEWINRLSDPRKDFPFKEWPEEHDIINNQDDCTLLLQGRSGTGKTTCCLYRLWNEFKLYWSKARPNDPRMSSEPSVIFENNSSNQDFMSLEHLHQVFITKNYVLCAQVKKKFYDFAAGNFLFTNHMEYEDVENYSCLSDVNDLSFPLFITARNFFIVLDNSLGDNKQFFSRTADGLVRDSIRSSDYDHENLDTLLDLNWEDGSEDESSCESSDNEQNQQQQQLDKKRPVKTEITASYFVEKIWPIISRVYKGKKADPLLIWMEIKSFIKGSREAVESENGYLSLKQYVDLGRKMAPHFVGDREQVYCVFEEYQLYVKLKADEDLFDECDFIHNLYKRLCEVKLPFSIHSFYVDEVQDFTQAELCVILRCCKHPNKLFFTGDTAQSIMRGVSFRFCDLTSLFQETVKKAKHFRKILPPKIKELKLNFRSHSGILDLAASVIKLLKFYFPQTIVDNLPEDKGCLPGSLPIVLDACSSSDLAVVLQGNKRQSSAIEFGAHQVIIVYSEQAKEHLPDVLKSAIVLTIFEAKGLEFDDVLLYNFFKDSKVAACSSFILRPIPSFSVLYTEKQESWYAVSHCTYNHPTRMHKG